MLAPRKTLWSTPVEVMERVIGLDELWPLKDTDRICDIGCGDGRCLLQWAQAYSNEFGQRMKDDPRKRQQQTISEGRSEQDNEKAENNKNDTATLLPMASFVGVDIEPERIQQARENLNALRQQGKIHPNLHVEFYSANALKEPQLVLDDSTTIVFVYLIPRGLRLITPVLLQHVEKRRQQQQESPLHVISYMSPLPGQTAVRTERVAVSHQPGAEWPIYVYRLEAGGQPQQPPPPLDSNLEAENNDG